VEAPSPEEELTTLVLNGVTSDHTKRSYRTGLEQFFAWLETKPRQPFSKALVGEYRAHLVQLKLSASTVNLRLSPLRKLAREMADNGLLDPGVASAIERTKGVTQEGVRKGNWLLKEQANELLNAPDPSTLKGKRDRAILALLISCGLGRRARRPRPNCREGSARREGRLDPAARRTLGYARPGGEKNRLRIVTVPAAKIIQGRVFRPVRTRDGLKSPFRVLSGSRE